MVKFVWNSNHNIYMLIEAVNKGNIKHQIDAMNNIVEMSKTSVASSSGSEPIRIFLLISTAIFPLSLCPDTSSLFEGFAGMYAVNIIRVAIVRGNPMDLRGMSVDAREGAMHRQDFGGTFLFEGVRCSSSLFFNS